MEGEYPILLGGQPIGQAQVRREGLYLCFSCRCRFSGEVIYRLTVSDDENTVNLGIPVPSGGRFCLDTRIPAKRFRRGALKFTALPKHSELTGKFVPLSPEEPFAYLNRLQNAYLQVRSGQVGIVIPETDDV